MSRKDNGRVDNVRLGTFAGGRAGLRQLHSCKKCTPSVAVAGTDEMRLSLQNGITHDQITARSEWSQGSRRSA